LSGGAVRPGHGQGCEGGNVQETVHRDETHRLLFRILAEPDGQIDPVGYWEQGILAKMIDPMMFPALLGLLTEVAGELRIQTDTESDFYLNVREYRCKGKPMFFGAAARKKIMSAST
jgi:hypothetical protein